jgi:hypothetical protein
MDDYTDSLKRIARDPEQPAWPVDCSWCGGRITGKAIPHTHPQSPYRIKWRCLFCYTAHGLTFDGAPLRDVDTDSP